MKTFQLQTDEQQDIQTVLITDTVTETRTTHVNPEYLRARHAAILKEIEQLRNEANQVADQLDEISRNVKLKKTFILARI